jgi:hypothetical protein
MFFSLHVTNQVSHPHQTTDKIIVLYILISIFFIADSKTKDFGLNGSRIPTFMSPFYPQFCSQNMNIHLVFSEFTSTSTLVTNKASVFLFLCWSEGSYQLRFTSQDYGNNTVTTVIRNRKLQISMMAEKVQQYRGNWKEHSDR